MSVTVPKSYVSLGIQVVEMTHLNQCNLTSIDAPT